MIKNTRKVPIPSWLRKRAERFSEGRYNSKEFMAGVDFILDELNAIEWVSEYYVEGVLKVNVPIPDDEPLHVLAHNVTKETPGSPG